jgi:vesicle transport through interaction with t-SNAREs protein 1
MDQTPAALFDAFEQDFRHIINSISEKLEGSGKNQLGGALNRCRCIVA